jgi:hypothetical protein
MIRRREVARVRIGNSPRGYRIPLCCYGMPSGTAASPSGMMERAASPLGLSYGETDRPTEDGLRIGSESNCWASCDTKRTAIHIRQIPSDSFYRHDRSTAVGCLCRRPSVKTGEYWRTRWQHLNRSTTRLPNHTMIFILGCHGFALGFQQLCALKPPLFVNVRDIFWRDGMIFVST